MDRSSAGHRRHDESLVVRLFGGDVSEPERERALALVADCDACAALFADLGAIASATAALPVSPRPRDFTLCADDAELLRPTTRRGLARLAGLGRVRSLGGSLVALGLAGFIVVAGVSAIAPPARDTVASAPGPAYAAGLQGEGQRSAATNSPGSSASSQKAPTMPQAVASGRADVTKDTSSSPGSGRVVLGPSGSGFSPNAVGTTNLPGNISAQATAPPDGLLRDAAGGSGQSGIDWRLPVVAGSVAFLFLGLMLLILPRRMPRRPAR